MNCTLCDSSSTEFAITRLGKQYFQCSNCKLVFLNPKQQMGFFEEKARYQTHNNDIRQAGYRRFLNQMWEPLRDSLPHKDVSILDFGCGPTKAFAELALEDGFVVESYDPYFFNDKDVLNRKYDVLWCSEVFEHFNSPAESVDKVFSLVNPGGAVAVMTDSYPHDPEEFKSWGYHNDPTHITFYSSDTMNWIAQKYKFDVSVLSKRVQIFKSSTE